MARKRGRARPTDPLEIARRRAAERQKAREPAAWGLDVVALALPANADVERRADLAGRVARARRADVFDLLLARGRLGQGAHDAVRRLQDDVALLHRGPAGVGAYAPRVDQSFGGESVGDARLRAGERVHAVLGLAGPASARLLQALCEPALALGQAGYWREIVVRETGERLADAQGAILRAACENLAGAYALIDRTRRRTA